MRFKRTLFIGLLACSALLINNSAYATPVSGVANIAGNVDVFDGTIGFNPTFSVPTGATETGDFAGLTGGTVQALSGGPTTGIVSVPNFITFTSGLVSPVVFDLTYVAPGLGTQAACSSGALGSVCTPTGSPFTLVQLGSNTVVIYLQLNGVAYTGTAASGVSPTVSVFTTQTANGTIPDIINLINSGGTLSGITYSAAFTATPPNPSTPEPASMMLMGVGLVGAGLVARRKIRS